jgi:hypothetical protein
LTRISKEKKHMEITIKLDSKVVETAVSKAWAEAFAPPQFRDSGGGYGYEEVKRQVKEYVANNLDLSALIATEVKLRMSSVIGDIVESAIRDMAKKKAKEMEKNGTLL